MAPSSAYGFVPLSRFVYQPPWAHAAQHDVPFEDGISGTLSLELEVRTPLCVAQDARRTDTGAAQERLPMQLGGRYVLPGSSIRGMLRNVVEIASYGKLSYTDGERRFAVRDISRADTPYATRMREARAGWLEIAPERDAHGEEVWQIIPCKLAVVDHRDLLEDLARRAGSAASKQLRDLFCPPRPQDRPRADAKYACWEQAPGGLTLRFDEEPGGAAGPRAVNLGRGAREGVLVFTGQPGPNKRLLEDEARREPKGKSREFVFHSPESARLAVTATVRRTFEVLHSSEGERHGGRAAPNPEWKYWRDRLRQGRRVPVFYLLNQEAVPSLHSFGLARMYRLPARTSVGEAIGNVAPEHRLAGAHDLAETIFGFTRSAAEAVGLERSALKGRVSVGFLRALGAPTVQGPFRGVLGAPKGSFYPYYVRQDVQADGAHVRGDYTDWMSGQARARGWKRYPARREARAPQAGQNASDRVVSAWRALAPGTRFEGELRVHNLRPAEFGALLWALDFGGRAECDHALGLAKPFGFGRVHLAAVKGDLRWALPASHAEHPTREAALAAFRSLMGDALGTSDFETTEPLVQLLAMSDARRAEGHDLQHPVLDHRGSRNDFKDIKSRKEALPEYVALPAATVPDASLAPKALTIQRMGREARERRSGRYVTSMDPRERVFELLGWPQARPAEPSAEARLLAATLPDRITPREAGRHADYRRAVAAAAPSAVVWARQEVQRLEQSAGALGALVEEVAALDSRKPEKHTKAYATWKAKKADAAQRLEQARRLAGRAGGDLPALRRFLEWLDAGPSQ